MIKSVQFIDNYFPIIDGVINTVHNYSINMDSVVVCPKMTRKYDTKDFPYEVISCPSIHIPKLNYALGLPKLEFDLTDKIAQHKPDILHLHSPALIGVCAISIGHKLGIPVVGTFHSKVYDAVLEFTKSRTLAKMASRKTARFYEKCDKVWACSEGTAQTLRSYGYRGDITVVTNGTDFTYPKEPEEIIKLARQEYGLDKSKHLLLFVGQMMWYKNIRLILDTFRLLQKESEDYLIVFAGNGKEERAIKDYAYSLNIPKEKMIFTGKVADQNMLKSLYLNADLLFFPSVYDNTPLVMREAAALGLPTLAAEGSNAAESILKNVNGYTAAANADAMCREIQKIFDDESSLKKVGQKAKETIPVKWEDLIPVVLGKYQEIIDEYRISHKL